MTRRATGPVTAAGKAISAQNARRHGLSAEPAADLVRAWFNVILDNSGDIYEEPNADTPRREAALRLAFDDWRFNLRRSNTEPLVRLNVEGKGNADALAAHVSEIANLLGGTGA